MAEYIPPALDWVRKQVEVYEGSGGTKGTTLLDLAQLWRGQMSIQFGPTKLLGLERDLD